MRTFSKWIGTLAAAVGLLALTILAFLGALADNVFVGSLSLLVALIGLHTCVSIASRWRYGRLFVNPHENANLMLGAALIGGVFLLAFWLSSLRRESEATSWQPPSFAQLTTTSGILKKGTGGDRYIKTSSGRSIEIVCANTRWRGPKNWCLYESEDPLIGTEVMVYHTPIFRGIIDRTNYYEMRSYGKRIVRYEQVLASEKHKREAETQDAGKFTFIVTGAWRYLLAYALLLRFLAAKQATPD